LDEQVGQEDTTQRSLFGPGTRLRQAREQAGLTLQQVAAQTRIGARHLEMIEAEDFAHLPARTYAIGFSRSYAKVVGLDGDEIVGEVREALDMLQPDQYSSNSATFEPGDPARVPSSGLGWLTALAALLLLVGGYFFYRSFFVPGAELPSLVERSPAGPKPPQHRAAAKPPAPNSGEVVFTALEDAIWVKFYDANGRQLMQKQMAKGETYVVPADAEGPQLWTGRPDALSITVGGKAVRPLADKEQVVKDVLVTAQALLARPATPENSATAASPTG
jgi:cytoskeleton protein RodZ